MWAKKQGAVMGGFRHEDRMCFRLPVASSRVGPFPGEVGKQPLSQGLLASVGSQMEDIISKALTV